MRKTIASIIFGILLIAVGVVYGGNILGFWQVDINFIGLWPLFIIVPCLFSIVADGPHFGNLLGLGIGAILLISAQDLLPNNAGYKLILPLVVIAIGLKIIFGRLFKNTIDYKAFTPDKKLKDFYAVFGGSEPNYNNLPFYGANSYAIFGGVEFNLKNAIITENCVINTYCVFGGVDINLPSNVKVVIESVPVFGGIDNKFYSSAEENAPTVLVNAVCVFGGCSIK